MISSFLCAVLVSRQGSAPPDFLRPFKGVEPSVTLMLGGDVMLNGIPIRPAPLGSIASLLRPASCAIVNLEIPLTTARIATAHKSASELQARTQFILKADPAHASAIAAAGIDMVSLGNNHCMDYRSAGLVQMLKALDKHRILYAGAGSSEDSAAAVRIYTTTAGVRIGLFSALAFMSPGALAHCTPSTPDRPGIATLYFGGRIDKRARARLAQIFKSTRERCDIVVAGLHWGIERQSIPTAYQVALGRACIDEGADVVWGNHPHVLQGGELYKGKPILYSMGNLISSKGGPTGLLKLVFTVDASRRGREMVVASTLFLPLRIASGQVWPVNGRPGQAAAKRYEDLSNLLLKRYPNKHSRPLVGPKSVQNRLK